MLGIVYATMRGKLSATLLNLRGIAIPLFAGIAPARTGSGIAMPYALAIFGGAICTAIFSGMLPHLRFQ